MAGSRLVSSLVVLVMLACGAARAEASVYSRTLDIPHYWQDDRCWCSITIVEQWSDWLNGDRWADRQAAIARRYGVAAYDTRAGQCPTAGLNVGQMANALEDYTSHWFGQYSTRSEDSLASKIVKEINSGEPAAVVGYTRYRYQEPVANQHYYLVHGFRNSTSTYSNTASKISGFFLHDPAYGASGLNHVWQTAPSTFVSRSTFTRDYASNGYRSKYYLVID